jgi:hypothetical protein
MAKIIWGVAASLLLSFGSANAMLIVSGDDADIVDVPENNDFDVLGAVGLDGLLPGAEISAAARGAVSVFYHFADSGFRNTFTWGTGSYTETNGNFGAAGLFIGSFDVNAGDVLNVGFLSNRGIAAGNGDNGFGAFLSRMVGLGSAAQVILGYDDGGAGPDNDYDDMIVRLAFEPAVVAEPGTLGLLGAGLVAMGVAARRRRA